MELNLRNERLTYDFTATDEGNSINGAFQFMDGIVANLNGQLMKGQANAGYCNYGNNGRQKLFTVSVIDDEDYEAFSALLRATVNKIQDRQGDAQ